MKKAISSNLLFVLLILFLLVLFIVVSYIVGVDFIKDVIKKLIPFSPG